MGNQSYTIVEGGGVTTPKGFKAGGLHCGLKKSTRHDIGVIVCDVPATAAAVYTTNLFQAAPLLVTREALGEGGTLRAVLVNSGNANACTGAQGEDDARTMQSNMAELLGVSKHEVAVASTGVIGELLKMDRVVPGIAQLPARLRDDAQGSDDFCQAILTTDLVKKVSCVTMNVDGRAVTIAGAAKGSGMIHPNMATMLGFVTTDVVIDAQLLQEVLREVTNVSFNMITVDGDTSTNDMLVAMASGLAENKPLTRAHPDFEAFVDGLLHYVQSWLKQSHVMARVPRS